MSAIDPRNPVERQVLRGGTSRMVVKIDGVVIATAENVKVGEAPASKGWEFDDRPVTLARSSVECYGPHGGNRAQRRAERFGRSS